MRTRYLLLALCCLFPTLAAQAADTAVPSPEQFQTWLHKDVDAGRPRMIAPFTGNAQNKTIAHSILDAMWAQPPYRENLEIWLAAHHDGTAEDMLDSWYRHYHAAFASSFEFLETETQKVLWLLVNFNAIYAMDRSACQTDSQEKIDAFIQAARASEQDKHASRLMADLPKALAREFARQNHPQSGDRPVPGSMVAIVLSSLKGVAKTWPADDEKRILNSFSYSANPPQRSPQEACETEWVVSHAIEDASLESPKEQLSSLLMRSSITSSAYDALFRRMDAYAGQARPTQLNFKPGKASIFIPRILVNANVAGRVQYKIDIDETGKVTHTAIENGGVAPEKVKSIDNTNVSSDALLLAIVNTYYQDGTFAPKVVDGKSVPFSISVPITWGSAH